MSKIVAAMSPLVRRMNADLTRRELAHMAGKHRRWPLNTLVIAKTPAGPMFGRVLKHWRSSEVPHGCSVEFPLPVDFGDANGARFAHAVSFRNLVKVRP